VSNEFGGYKREAEERMEQLGGEVAEWKEQAQMALAVVRPRAGGRGARADEAPAPPVPPGACARVEGAAPLQPRAPVCALRRVPRLLVCTAVSRGHSLSKFALARAAFRRH
jgi:hypothetical protein